MEECQIVLDKQKKNSFILIALLFATFYQPYTSSYFYEILNMELQLALFSILSFSICKGYKAKSILTALMIYECGVFLSDWLILSLNSYLYIIEFAIFSIITLFQNYKSYNCTSDKPNKRTVCLIFYKPVTFKQYLLSLFGAPVSSSGLIIGDKKYQLKYGNPTIQASNWDLSILSKYYVIDTGVSVEDVKHLIPDLLTKRARSKNHLYFRLNCLSSLSCILDKLPNKWKYKGEVLPSLYLRNRL